MFDITTLLWTSVGAAALAFAFIDYSLTYRKRTGKDPFLED